MDLIQLHNYISSQRDVSQDSLSVEAVLGEVVEALQGQGKARFYSITGLA